ncbi:hypothetical protein ACFLZX_05540, partial [Nanoarchaeota archaeon]
IIMIMFIVGLLSIGSALGCSCAFGSVPSSFENADQVFTGKVSNIKLEGEYNKVTFEVYKIYKGIEPGGLTVYTHQHGATCGYGFIEGSEYVVFANEGKNRLQVSLCSRTQRLEQAEETINFLEGDVPELEILPEEELDKLESDNYELRNVDLDGDILSLEISHGGGDDWEGHTFRLVWDGTVAKSYPPKAYLYLIYDNGGDLGKALRVKYFSFDMSNLRNSPVVNNKGVIIKIIGPDGKEIEEIQYGEIDQIQPPDDIPQPPNGDPIQPPPLPNDTKEPPKEEKGLFSAIWGWIKGIFS